ncbi:hypothetical protein WKW80_05665 [Variovorax humicola]|uniref:Uncharacterized protein n=1 Tax=Variovorax humicola TaxID=1769758 RepID=A0ABU8VVR2_9BURK
MNETYRKVISTVGRIDSAKKVTEMLENLVRLEREAYGISTVEAGTTDPLASLLQRIGRSALTVVANPTPDDDAEDSRLH